MFTEVKVAGSTVRVTLTSDASIVKEFVLGLMSSHNKEKLVVGLDVEWTSKDKDPNSRVPILQLCHKDRCLIVQMVHLAYYPQSLKEFLSDCNVTFVGVGITGDISKLRKDYDLNCQNAVELGELADRHLTGAGLFHLAREVLGIEINKNTNVATNTDWSSKSLSHDQIVYAATDAYVSYLIGDKLLGKK